MDDLINLCFSLGFYSQKISYIFLAFLNVFVILTQLKLLQVFLINFNICFDLHHTVGMSYYSKISLQLSTTICNQKMGGCSPLFQMYCEKQSQANWTLFISPKGRITILRTEQNYR